jgi:hypothetical protein
MHMWGIIENGDFLVEALNTRKEGAMRLSIYKAKAAAKNNKKGYDLKRIVIPFWSCVEK